MKRTPDDILKTIKELYSKNGYPPSIRDLCKEYNLKSSSSIFHYIDILKDRGDIIPKGKTYTVRGIKITFDDDVEE